VGPQSEHLSDAQIEQYAAPARANVPEHAEQETSNGGDWIETHLADCAACRERVLVLAQARFLLSTDPSVKTRRHADRRGTACLDEEVLRDLAAGLLSGEQTPKITAHAAQCDRCGPLLRMYVEDYSQGLSQEDTAMLGKLKSRSARWQNKITTRMLADSKITTKKPITTTQKNPKNDFRKPPGK